MRAPWSLLRQPRSYAFFAFKCRISYADGKWSSDFLWHFHVRKIWCSNWEKRWYLMTTLVDESFSLNYLAKIPDHLDKGWYMFFVSFYLHLYWIVGAGLGNLFGSIIPFDLKGVEFGMTALFLVIFAENWLKEKFHESSLLGLGVAFVSLLIVGKEHFLVPTLISIWILLTVRRPKLSSKLEALK